MKATDTIANEVLRITSGNDIYTSYYDQWKYLLESYIGGAEYKEAGHLVKYQNETSAEYNSRLYSTPLDNHCQSVVSVYTSFLFRAEPYRELGAISNDSQLEDFLRDCDYEGRTLDHFMKDLSIWVSVFGHAWMMISKPSVGATTAAEEAAAGVRPYLSMMTPLTVLDWDYSRSITGRYELIYLKYIEEINGDVLTIKEWTPLEIKTTVVDNENKVMIGEPTYEINGLGKIPAVLCYNKRSSVRGIGVSDIADIADLQKFIYNATSEVDQSIRLNTHPSLVKTPNTLAGIGAGSIIHMDESMDPALKPYLLEFNGASIESIHATIDKAVEAIDRIANTGGVRARETKTLSGVAMETEFQMLNARLAEKANSIELAEETMWKLWAEYMGYMWDGVVSYPMSFNIRDAANDLNLYLTAMTANVPSPTLAKEMHKAIADLVIENEDKLPVIYQEIEGAPVGDFEMEQFEPHLMVDPSTGEQEMAETEERHLELQAMGWIHI